MTVCPTCGHVILESARITDRELDVLSAWVALRSVKLAASWVGVGEQRAKNLLAALRRRTRAETNMDLAVHFAGRLRSAGEVRRAA